MVETNAIYVVARLTGRCANGAERDGGRRTHAVPLGSTYGLALCGARPGRLSNGWDEVDGAEMPTCSRCTKKASKS
jgi:hypothetical protein